jgi:hypothetical protein
MSSLLMEIIAALVTIIKFICMNYLSHHPWKRKSITCDVLTCTDYLGDWILVC